MGGIEIDCCGGGRRCGGCALCVCLVVGCGDGGGVVWCEMLIIAAFCLKDHGGGDGGDAGDAGEEGG